MKIELELCDHGAVHLENFFKGMVRALEHAKDCPGQPAEPKPNPLQEAYESSPRSHLMPPVVLAAIMSERSYQRRRWPNHSHTVGEWLLIMQKCLDDAKRAWVTGHGDNSALHEIRQVVAVGVAAMGEHGAPLREIGKTTGERLREAFRGKRPADPATTPVAANADHLGGVRPLSEVDERRADYDGLS